MGKMGPGRKTPTPEHPRELPRKHPSGAWLRRLTPAIPHISLSNRFEQRGATLLEKNALTAYDFHKSIPDTAAAKIYANEHEKYIKSFNDEFVERIFPDKPLPRSSHRVEKKRI